MIRVSVSYCLGKALVYPKDGRESRSGQMLMEAPSPAKHRLLRVLNKRCIPKAGLKGAPSCRAHLAEGREAISRFEVNIEVIQHQPNLALVLRDDGLFRISSYAPAQRSPAPRRGSGSAR
jgi:hypothetical protein